MIVKKEIIDELCYSAGETRVEKAKKYVEKNRVNLTKVIYDDNCNFEVKAIVKGDSDIYHTYISVCNEEIEDLTCDCPDYYSHYGACKHIIATILEFERNKEYAKLFAGEQEKIEDNIRASKIDNYREFKELINEFYEEEDQEIEKQHIQTKRNIMIIPKLIYNEYSGDLKIEFKIGDKQTYKLKNLVDFYNRMQNNETYKYGQKLEFKHEREAFTENSLPILDFIMKYSEIIKYANSAMGNYTYYGKSLNEGYITISNTGMDELYEILKNKRIRISTMYYEKDLLFSNENFKIEFNIEENNKGEYKLTTDMDIYEYDIIDGKEYKYIMTNGVLYKLLKEQKDSLKLLDFLRKNHSEEIIFPKEQTGNLFSIVMPKIKKDVKLKNVKKEEIEKYIPEQLYVKVFLDYNDDNFIIAEIRFCYGNEEFNPLSEENVNMVRNSLDENKVINLFIKTGFLLDRNNNRLILTDEEKIYDFLAYGIEEYMQKFEVLATDNFKSREIKQPKIMSMGVKVENNLLDINIEGMNFDKNELVQIMEKYHLKKKYHRLKNGEFIKLEQNETMDFIENTLDGMGLDYKELQEGKIKVPMYRSLYLDRILSNLNSVKITKDSEYKDIVEKLHSKDIEDIKLPKNLNAELRDYQKIGYKWLKVLDEYSFGGILADDMGLRKNTSVNSNYIIIYSK